MERTATRKGKGCLPMVLDLLELIGGAVREVPFAYEQLLESADARELSDDLLSGSLHVEGRAENHAGYLKLIGEAVLEGTFRCGRCCREFSRVLRFPMDYQLAESLAGEDTEEFLLLTDGQLDLSDVVRSQLLLELPYRFLCKEDCKGLCPKCGCDRNTQTCECDLRDRDPRWAVLGEFFDEEETT